MIVSSRRRKDNMFCWFNIELLCASFNLVTHKSTVNAVGSVNMWICAVQRRSRSLGTSGRFAHRLVLWAGSVCAAGLSCSPVEIQMRCYHTLMEERREQSLCLLKVTENTPPLSIVVAPTAALLSCDEFLATTAGNAPSFGWTRGSLHFSWNEQTRMWGNVAVFGSSDPSSRGHTPSTRPVQVTLKMFNAQTKILIWNSCRLVFEHRWVKANVSFSQMISEHTWHVWDSSRKLWDRRCQGKFSDAWSSRLQTFSWRFPGRQAPKMEAVGGNLRLLPLTLLFQWNLWREARAG